MLYEVRHYHVDPAVFADFRRWAAAEGIPYLKGALDVVGFWYATDDAPEGTGTPDPLGPPNVTWIIRWADMAERRRRLPEVLGHPAWQRIFATVPGGRASYRRTASRFSDQLG
jgi:hypothetical protein